MRGAGDGQVRRRDVLSLDAVPGHGVQVGRVHVAVVVPAEAVEGDQQHLLSQRRPVVLRDRGGEGQRGQGEAGQGKGQQHFSAWRVLQQNNTCVKGVITVYGTESFKPTRPRLLSLFLSIGVSPVVNGPRSKVERYLISLFFLRHFLCTFLPVCSCIWFVFVFMVL